MRFSMSLYDELLFESQFAKKLKVFLFFILSNIEQENQYFKKSFGI